MEHYLILARSVTYAQRMHKQLERAGIRSQILRPPREISGMGCAYALRIGMMDLTGALVTLHQAGLNPVQIFLYQFGAYQEVEE